MKAPNNNVFYRNSSWKYPKIINAKGIYLYDEDGKEYIDGCSGSAVSNIGHGNEEVAQVAAEQIKKVAFTHLSRFTTNEIEECASKVASLTPQGLDHVYFVSGGSEATETSWKLARQFFVERDGEKSNKTGVISRWNSFHGNTMGSLSMTGIVERRRIYESILSPFNKINQCYCYRCPYLLTPNNCQLECAQELKLMIDKEGADSIMAFIAEPIIGAAVPALVPPSNYFKVIKDICHDNDVLLIIDEVMMGFGRTGKNFGIDHFGILPDIMAIAKGMSCGYSPVGAAIASDEVFSTVMEKGSGQFIHGHTYGGNALSMKIATTVIDIMEKENCTQNAEKMGVYLLDKLNDLSDYSFIGDIRGKGLIFGIEFVENKKSKAPYLRKFNLKGKITKICMDEGLVVYPGGGTVDGINGDHILIAPPLNITKTEVNELFLRLKKSFDIISTQL